LWQVPQVIRSSLSTGRFSGILMSGNCLAALTPTGWERPILSLVWQLMQFSMMSTLKEWGRRPPLLGLVQQVQFSVLLKKA